MKVEITCARLVDTKFDNYHKKSIVAFPCKIKGFGNYKFAVHRNKHTVYWSTYLFEKYVVSELSTGMIVSGGKTKADAIKNTETLLSSKGMTAVKKEIDKQQKIITKKMKRPC